MTVVSARELQNHTAALLQRAQAGEQMTVTVSRRPVAQLGPVTQPAWVSGEAMERVLRETPADSALLDDLNPLRGQTISSDFADAASKARV
jgi:prevent-host-death family protein